MKTKKAKNWKEVIEIVIETAKELSIDSSKIKILPVYSQKGKDYFLVYNRRIKRLIKVEND